MQRVFVSRAEQRVMRMLMQQRTRGGWGTDELEGHYGGQRVELGGQIFQVCGCGLGASGDDASASREYSLKLDVLMYGMQAMYSAGIGLVASVACILKRVSFARLIHLQYRIGKAYHNTSTAIPPHFLCPILADHRQHGCLRVAVRAANRLVCPLSASHFRATDAPGSLLYRSHSRHQYGCGR